MGAVSSALEGAGTCDPATRIVNSERSPFRACPAPNVAISQRVLFAHALGSSMRREELFGVLFAHAGELLHAPRR